MRVVGATRRFLVFAGDTYDESGGAADFVVGFDTREEVERFAAEKVFPDRVEGLDWWNAIDTQAGEVFGSWVPEWLPGEKERT